DMDREVGHRADGDQPGGQPVEAVDQVDGVDEDDHQQHGEGDAELGGEADDALVEGADRRQPEEQHLDPAEGHGGGGQDLAGQLDRGRQALERVDDADRSGEGG